MSDVYAALVRARMAVEQHVADADRAGITWHEETVTDLYLLATQPEARFTTFTRSEEAQLGADWLWWFVDQRGEAFGSLVQAKRVKGLGRTAKFDFSQSSTSGKQIEMLGRSAKLLSVAAIYSLYLGSYESRDRVPCSNLHIPTNCPYCAPASVSLAPHAPIAKTVTLGDTSLESVLQWSIPAETLVDGDAVTGANSTYLRWISQIAAGSSLDEFLKLPQSGAREIAKGIAGLVARMRFGEFATLTEASKPEVVTDARVFPELPIDEPYLGRVLCGLRTAPPSYVLDVLAGGPVTAELPRNVAGIAVFSM